MRVKKVESLGIDLRVYFDNGKIMVFCSKAISWFYQAIGGFKPPVGCDFDFELFKQLEKNI